MQWIYYSENYLSITKFVVIYNTVCDKGYTDYDFFSVTYHKFISDEIANKKGEKNLPFG